MMHNYFFRNRTGGIMAFKASSMANALARLKITEDPNDWECFKIDDREPGEVRVADIILEQLGGNRFAVMTGASNFLSDGNKLCMTLPRNMSKANRLHITLTPDDLYTMRFFRYTPGRLNRKTWKFTEDKVTEIKTVNGIYCDQLQEIFTQVTGMYTHL